MMALGSVLTTLGITNVEEWGTVVNGVIAIGGGALMITPVILGMFKHSATGTIEAAANLPEVKKVVTTPTLATASPSPKVVDR
jgi:hypothetical protein